MQADPEAERAAPGPGVTETPSAPVGSVAGDLASVGAAQRLSDHLACRGASLLTGAPDWPSRMEAGLKSFVKACRHFLGQGTVNSFGGDGPSSLNCLSFSRDSDTRGFCLTYSAWQEALTCVWSDSPTPEMGFKVTCLFH